MRKRLGFLLFVISSLFIANFAHSAPMVSNCTDGPIGAPYKGVQAYSNAPYQGTGKSCGGDAANNRDTYGYLYQCVEFVRRFYATNTGTNKGNIGDSWPRIATAADMWMYPTAMGLKRFQNGITTERPQPDDILVFDGKGAGSAGHVAIVVNVTDSSVKVLEQNWSTQGYVTLPAMVKQDGTYYIPDRGSYTIHGWMGKHASVATNITYQPANDIGGQDIWTTSVYSYAPGGGGPGGGANGQWLKVGGWGDLYYSLIQFDLSTLPDVATSAKIELFQPTFYSNTATLGTTGVYVDQIASFWDWRIQGTGSDMDRLWWADRPSVFLTPGLPLPAPVPGEWYNIDITSLYNAWKSGTPNFGIQLRPVSNNNQWAIFYSSNYADNPALRPKLVVTTDTTVPACMDGIDNDNDSVTDAADPGCWADPTDPSTYDPFDNDENNLGDGICQSVSGETPLTAPFDCQINFGGG